MAVLGISSPVYFLVTLPTSYGVTAGSWLRSYVLPYGSALALTFAKAPLVPAFTIYDGTVRERAFLCGYCKDYPNVSLSMFLTA